MARRTESDTGFFASVTKPGSKLGSASILAVLSPICLVTSSETPGILEFGSISTRFFITAFHNTKKPRLLAGLCVRLLLIITL